jgi:hypothetical protein
MITYLQNLIWNAIVSSTDLNNDGVTDAKDAIILLQKILVVVEEHFANNKGVSLEK